MNGNIPVIHVCEKTIPQACEKAILEVWEKGIEIKTQYDGEGVPSSKDATVIITVEEPFTEPRIYKNFPGGPEELEIYRQEVLNGIHNHWIDPEHGKWLYTYNQRLFSYVPGIKINQIDFIINSLSECFYTRRSQAITYYPPTDSISNDPPCLQRIWCRIIENNNELFLNMNTHWRSRDLYKAWFMNTYALTELQKIIAEKVSKKINRIVKIGRYVDISDSLHINGNYFKNVELEIEKIKTTPIKNRVWETTHPAFKIMTEEAKEKIKDEQKRI